jgi:hypothetical protein
VIKAKEDEIDGTFSMNWRDEKWTEFYSEYLQGRDRLGDTGCRREGNIKTDLKSDTRAWRRFKFLSMRTNGELL